jgi:hypothetical protein|tara:strand:- start:1539 stop:1892 length:354 start_codon:yes stop_codon:yes gene_type:complete
MANTFKVITVAGTTSQATVYTVGSSTTTVVLGVMLGNTTTSQVTATVTLSSDTSSRPPSGTNSGNNADVELVTNAPIPAGSSLELLSGNKIVMETTDSLKLTASGATDIAVSIMEIT